MLEAVIENQTPRTQSVAFSYALYCTNLDMRDVYDYMCILYVYIVNSTVPAVTLPVAGYAHIHVWLYRAQDRSGGRRWNQKAL